MAFKFKELKVWQRALELSNEIDISGKRKYINLDTFKSNNEEYEILCKMITKRNSM